DFFFVVGGLCQDHSERIAKERLAPKFQSSALYFVAADVARLVSHAVHHRNINSICDRVRALDSAPCIVLRRPVLLFLCRVAAYRGRVEEHLGARERGQARAFWIPLVPAHQSADASEVRVECLEAEITWREIKLFI